MTQAQAVTIEVLNLDYQIPVSRLFGHLQALPKPVWLDSGYPAPNHGRFDILSAMPASAIELLGNNESDVKDFLSRASSALNGLGKPSSSRAAPFQGGLIGYLGYDLHRQQAGLVPRQGLNLPEGYFGLYLWAIVYDHHSQVAQAVFHPQCARETKQRVIELINAAADESTPLAHEDFHLINQFTASETKEDYLRKIHRIKEYIYAGDVYQVNYAQHFCAEYQGSHATAYMEQRSKHPAPFSAYIGLEQQALLSHSPEAFILIQGREVQTLPIKGTTPRADNPHLDQRNADLLQSSLKDRAENLMIVDLLRNDLGKSCEPGSIRVPKLFELQSFSNVHHLVSQVRGRLTEDTDALRVLQHCHPGGSITGAPKVRSMQVIDELEKVPRSAYCGNIGFLSCCGHTSTNIAIRTMVADGRHMHCWGGGGIVADSIPEKEYQETLFKVGPMMDSLEELFLWKSQAS